MTFSIKLSHLLVSTHYLQVVAVPQLKPWLKGLPPEELTVECKVYRWVDGFGGYEFRNKMMPSYEISEGIRLKLNIQELHCLDLHLSVML